MVRGINEGAAPGGGAPGLLRRHRLLLLLVEDVAAEHTPRELRRDAVRRDDVHAAVEPLAPQRLHRGRQVSPGPNPPFFVL